jgi:ubiquinone/menaquinone biosynthesis C-methylase UbiE
MSTRDTLTRTYVRLRKLIAPDLQHCQDAYADALSEHVHDGVRWLDLGCGHQVLPDWHAENEKRFVGLCSTVVGIDADLESLRRHSSIGLRTQGEISLLPFRDESFDLVTANMVVEHLENPVPSLREIARVLVPGGVCIFVTPNARGYATRLARYVPDGLKRRVIRVLDGRPSDDVFHTYYRANTDDRVRQLAEMSSFDVVGLKLVNSEALFSIVPPLAALELLWIRLLMTEPFRQLRPDIVAILRKRRDSPTVTGLRHGSNQSSSEALEKALE